MINFSDFLREPEPAGGRTQTDPPKREAGPSLVSKELSRVETVSVSVSPESRIVFHLDPRSPGADRFRLLRMRLRALWTSGKLKSLLITSALPGDGKSTVALNLATALAEGGKRTVLLVEGDLYHPSLASALGLENHVGLAECLEDGIDPMTDAIRRVDPLQFYLLSAGNPKGNSTELLQSDALAIFKRAVSPHFDWVIFDSPPVAPLTDALAVSRHTDATLLVARADQTPRESIEEAIMLLGPEHVLGIVLNAVSGLNKTYSKYYGYYGKK